MAIVILASLLFCEGVGLFLFHSNLPYALTLIPCFLFIFHSFYYGNFSISFSPSSFFLGCSTLLYALSIINSVNKEASIESIIVFIFLYLLYLYFSSYPVKERKISAIIYMFSLIFIGGFLVYSNQKVSPFRFLVPQTEYQLISPFYNPHNHLGDFLGLGIIASFYYFITTSKRIHLIPLLLFIPFVLISFSNSAYMSITLALTILFVSNVKKYSANIRKVFFILFILFMIMAVMSISSTKGSEQMPFFNKTQQAITKHFAFYPKMLGSSRLSYFSQALQGIKRNPILGIGPNNFAIISQQLKTTNDDFSTDVHNIFLEMGVEAGLPALLCFLIFIALRIRHGILKPSLSFFLFLYLLLNFQTDYTYKIYSVILLFMFFASQTGQHSQNKNTTLGICAFASASIFLQIVIVCIISSLILQKTGNPAKAVFFNPFNRYAYYDLLKEASANNNGTLVDIYADKLHTISKVNLQSELEIISAYKAVGKPQKLFNALETAYQLQPLLPPAYIEQLYALTVQYRSKKQGDDIITSYILGRQKAPYFIKDKQTIDELTNLCKKTYKKGCDQIE